MLGYITHDQLNAAGVTYDSALPQEIWRQINAAVNQNPLGHIVVVYQSADHMGGLVPVTREGARMLELWEVV